MKALLYPVSTFSISKASANCFVWDITQPAEPQQQDYTLDEAAARFSSPSDQLHEYIIFDNEIPAPELVGKIENQNLHGLNDTKFCHHNAS